MEGYHMENQRTEPDLSSNIDALFRRVELFFEDEEYQQVYEYTERILDIDPEYAPAYLAKFMADIGVNKEEAIVSIKTIEEFDNKNWKRALRFASLKQKKIYEGYFHKVEEQINDSLFKWDGDSRFGTYEWIPLVLREDNVLVITKDVIDSRRFDSSTNEWESSELKEWLNNEFINTFDYAQQKSIQEFDDSKIFLLSEDEANKYFPDDYSRRVQSGNRWWLRTPRYSPSFVRQDGCAAFVDSEGSTVSPRSASGVECHLGVRPALWLRVKPGISSDQAMKGNPKEISTIEQERIEKDYKLAIEHYNNKEYKLAYESFVELKEYKHSARMLDLIDYKRPIWWISSIGDTGKIGNLLWKVLDIRGDLALLHTNDGVAYSGFDENSNIWADSGLRTWLNSDFFDEYIGREKKYIVETNNTDTNTIDKVFLLSLKEFKRYFSGFEGGKVYALKGSSYQESPKSWWLRTPDVRENFIEERNVAVAIRNHVIYDYTQYDSNFVASGLQSGYLVEDEYNRIIHPPDPFPSNTTWHRCNEEANYVRPAIWIDLSR